MKKRMMIIHRSKLGLQYCIFMLGCCLGQLNGRENETKVDMPGTATTTFSPPEGNATFIDGTTWCVASSGASQEDLQNAVDWACGPGMADCSAIQPGQPCYQANNLLTVASYAFNSYYQQNGDSPVACNFGGSGMVTTTDPSFGSCEFPTSGNTADNSSSPSRLSQGISSWLIPGVLFLLHLLIQWEGILSQLRHI
eukprot:Gb_00481 [translate_table: standard]